MIIKSTDFNGQILYQSSPDGMSLSEINRNYDPEYDEELDQLVSYPLVEGSQFWNIVSMLIKDSMNSALRDAQGLTAVFNPNQSNDSALEQLAIRYGVEFPDGYSTDKQRLILKYYPNFVKLKGVTPRVLDILMLVGHSEEDLYSQTITKDNTYSVEFVSNGYYKVNLVNHLPDDVYRLAQRLVDQLTSEGTCYQVINPEKDGE